MEAMLLNCFDSTPPNQPMSQHVRQEMIAKQEKNREFKNKLQIKTTITARTIATILEKHDNILIATY